MKMDRLETRLLQSAAWRLITEWVTIPWVLSSASGAGESLDFLLGSRPGITTGVIARRHPSWAITASEMDPDMVARAQRLLESVGRSGIRVVRPTPPRLPFQTASSGLRARWR
jgi:hypothetical protein